MNKLSKEQAEWLIEQFQAKWLGHDAIKGEIQDSLALTTLKLVVNQCTEKEFPEFDMKWSDKDGYSYTAVASADEEEICINYTDDICCCDPNVNNYFSFEKFLEYAEHIQKIAEWVKEQE